MQEALYYWRRFVRMRGRRLWVYTCAAWECCPDFHLAREILEVVAHQLGGRDARRFRATLAVLDEQW
ncbi:hypothetical protein [Nocardia sp. NPDC050710]|uniref:hypothetical protein n=1 Tax=Nocardia sp. NPDC050710 TaxID=3157220 RepID=UPI0034101B7A